MNLNWYAKNGILINFPFYLIWRLDDFLWIGNCIYFWNLGLVLWSSDGWTRMWTKDSVRTKDCCLARKGLITCNFFSFIVLFICVSHKISRSVLYIFNKIWISNRCTYSNRENVSVKKLHIYIYRAIRISRLPDSTLDMHCFLMSVFVCFIILHSIDWSILVITKSTVYAETFLISVVLFSFCHKRCFCWLKFNKLSLHWNFNDSLISEWYLWSSYWTNH